MHFFTVAVQKNPFFADILGPHRSESQKRGSFPAVRPASHQYAHAVVHDSGSVQGDATPLHRSQADDRNQKRHRSKSALTNDLTRSSNPVEWNASLDSSRSFLQQEESIVCKGMLAST